MELEIHRQERISAPLQLVWEEIDTLDRILAKLPQISDYDVVPGGQKARGKAKLAWGPVKWNVDLEISIVEFSPRQHLTWVVEGPSLEIHHQARIELTRIGESETRVDYRGTLDVRHRAARRMRGLFNEIAEDQAHSLLRRMKVKAEQRRLAQERLLK